MSRHFRALRTVTLPQGCLAGPGGTNLRLDPGSFCTLADHAGAFERFIQNRLQLGDLEQVTEVPADAPAPRPLPNPGRSAPDSQTTYSIGAAAPRKD
ncbi:MAG: hypothetical protein ACTHU0_22735 [Kofleriaceae bacterium]